MESMNRKTVQRSKTEVGVKESEREERPFSLLGCKEPWQKWVTFWDLV